MAPRLLCSLVFVSLLVSPAFAKKKPFPKIIGQRKIRLHHDVLRR